MYLTGSLVITTKSKVRCYVSQAILLHSTVKLPYQRSLYTFVPYQNLFLNVSKNSYNAVSFNVMYTIQSLGFFFNIKHNVSETFNVSVYFHLQNKYVLATKYGTIFGYGYK